MRKLNRSRDQLLDLIEADSAFVTELASPDVACILWRQRERIVEMLHRRDRCERLLDFLSRRSVADFQNFIKILAKRQAHLVPLIETDEGEIYFEVEFAGFMDRYFIFHYLKAIIFVHFK